MRYFEIELKNGWLVSGAYYISRDDNNEIYIENVNIDCVIDTSNVEVFHYDVEELEMTIANKLYKQLDDKEDDALWMEK